MSAAVPAEVARAEAEIELLTARLRPRFRRGAGHRHAGEYVRGLLGTAGRIENCQVGVFLGYAGLKGRAGLDRALYLSRGWADDAGRRAEAGVPETVAS